jgi:abequosyltransferase
MQEVSNSVNASQPLLTIAIPTWNRAEYLDLCLKRVNEDINSLSEGRRKLVKVYVSNNASTDDTEEVILKYLKVATVEFEVVKNSENIGGERNVAQCYLSAKTPYVWVLGDDDVVLSGGLLIILNILQKREVDVLYLNGYPYSNNYLDEPKRWHGKAGTVEYSSALKFVKDTHVMLTFISALIVRSGVNLQLTDCVTKGSNLPQLGWVLPSVRDGKKFIKIKKRIYAAKQENSGGYGPIKVFGHNLCNIANNVFHKQPHLAKTMQNGAIVTWFPTFILSYRGGNQIAQYLSEDVAADLESVFKENWRYYFFLKPIISLPINLANFYYKFIRLSRLLFRPFLI